MRRLIVATPHERNSTLIKKLADRLPNYQVIWIKTRDELDAVDLENLGPEWIFFPHWSWLIPREIYEEFECVVFHMTDLPYGRGGSPLQNLIVRGHKETKLSALKCTAGLDTGPVYKKLPLSLDGTAEEILRRAANLMEDMIVEIVKNHPRPVDQSGEIVEFKRRHPEDGNISSLQNLNHVYDYIRMLDADGYRPAYIQTPYLEFDFSQARLEDGWVEARVRIRRKMDG